MKSYKLHVMKYHVIGSLGAKKAVKFRLLAKEGNLYQILFKLQEDKMSPVTTPVK